MTKRKKLRVAKLILFFFKITYIEMDYDYDMYEGYEEEGMLEE